MSDYTAPPKATSTSTPAPVLAPPYKRSFDDFLLHLGKSLVHNTISEGEIQKAGLEKLASSVGLGFFTKRSQLPGSEFYEKLVNIAPQSQKGAASALASIIPIGQTYVGEFAGKTLRITHETTGYVFSR